MPTKTTTLRPGAASAARSESESNAVATQDAPPETTMVVTGSLPAGISGEIDRGDIVLPTINIVNGNGAMAESFEKGNIVLNRETVLSEGETPVDLTVLSLKKYYLENVEWGGDARPRSFDTLEQVKAAGLHCDWVDGEKAPASAAADAIVVVSSDKENPNLPFEFDGRHYAVALWRLTGTAYTRAAKLIITASQWSLKSGLANGSWSLTTKVEKFGKNSVFVPVLKAGPRNPEALVAFYHSLQA